VADGTKTNPILRRAMEKGKGNLRKMAAEDNGTFTKRANSEAEHGWGVTRRNIKLRKRQ